MKQIKILYLSIVIFSIYMIYHKRRKVDKSLFVELENLESPHYYSFLQPRKKYIYRYNGSIKDLDDILKTHHIDYLVIAKDRIYHCKSLNFEFEIRLDNNYIEFIPIVGSRMDFDDLINFITR